MPQNKKHHFVPKFYLRNFSGDGKSIGIYNIPSQRMIPRGNLGNQCYRDYFYGREPGVEHALAGMEGAAAHVINHALLKHGAAPVALSSEHIVLSHFVVLQAARTGYEAAASAETADKFFKAIYRDQFGDLDNYEIGFDDPVLMSLRVASRIVPSVYDLKVKLLRNETEVGFVASDNPIVRHNQHYEGNDFAGHTGWGQAGLQVFLPLSPKYLCVFYDAETYKVGGKNMQTIVVTSPQDVATLNALQWLNAHENIYFAEGQQHSVLAQAPQVVGRRRAEKSSVSEYRVLGGKAERSSPGTQRSLLHEFRPGLNIRLNVGCIRVRRHPKHPQHKHRPAPARDGEYLRVVEKFGEQLAARKAGPEEFFSFAAHHARAARP